MSDTNVHRVVGNLLVGTSHFFVDTTTNQVGINTSSPSAALDVATGDLKVGSGITLGNNGTITATGGFSGDGSLLENVAGDSGSWVNGSSSNIHLAVSTDNVGIGIDNPAHKLDVNGDINISSGSTLRVDGTPAVFSNWSVDGSDIYRSSGNVGIGTVSPATYLHLSAKNSSPGSTEGDNIGNHNLVEYLRFTSTSDSGDINAISTGFKLGEGDTSSSPVGRLDICANSYADADNSYGSTPDVTVATFLGSGNVGIGVVSPGAELHVAGTGAIIIPSGNTSQRPGAIDGMLRVNTETGFLEVYNGAWISVVPGVGAIGWEIIMRTSGKKINYSTSSAGNFGSPGTGSYNLTASSTNASSRTSFGDAVGLYDAFFTKTGITKIALVSGTGNNTDMTSHSQYIVYDLVESTNAESLYNIIKRLDDYNQNNASWSANDSLFGSSSVINFTAGTNGLSGTRTGNVSSGIRDETGAIPERFCIWGINRDSDNDTQVLCAYSGNLQTGKGDQWRGGQPKQSFWSYWGNDWHASSLTQTLSRGVQSSPGIGDSVNSYTGDIYLMAF